MYNMYILSVGPVYHLDELHEYIFNLLSLFSQVEYDRPYPPEVSSFQLLSTICQDYYDRMIIILATALSDMEKCLQKKNSICYLGEVSGKFGHLLLMDRFHDIISHPGSDPLPSRLPNLRSSSAELSSHLHFLYLFRMLFHYI